VRGDISTWPPCESARRASVGEIDARVTVVVGDADVAGAVVVGMPAADAMLGSRRVSQALMAASGANVVVTPVACVVVVVDTVGVDALDEEVVVKANAVVDDVDDVAVMLDDAVGVVVGAIAVVVDVVVAELGAPGAIASLGCKHQH
jgi:hypothetical protein